MYIKTKEWIAQIQAENFKAALTDIQTTVFENVNEEENRNIFKVFISLANAVSKCDKKSQIIGKQIYKLTHTLHSTLTKVPDTDRFIRSVYHMTDYLLNVNLPEEAAQICSFLSPGNLIVEDVTDNKIIVNILYLWHNAIKTTLHALKTKPQDTNLYNELKRMIEHEFELIKVTYKKYTRHLLTRIYLYLEKLADLKNKELFNNFYVYVIKYLGKQILPLDKEHEHLIYNRIIHICTRILCKNITEDRIKSARSITNDMLTYFNTIFEDDKECYQCFHGFREICTNLVQSPEYLTSDNFTCIQECMNDYKSFIQMYGYTEVLRLTMTSLAQIMEPIFIYWENCLRNEQKNILEHNILLGLMTFIGSLSALSIEQPVNKCMMCSHDKCTIKRNIYNGVVVKLKVTFLVSKLSPKDLSHDIFIITCTFLKEIASLVYKIKQSECNSWSSLWDNSKVLIYNFGCISEQFYEESVSLYACLCSYIILFQGIPGKRLNQEPKINLCSALHTLSSVHYRKKMYREALTASALNGLLSYQDVDSKAFDTWFKIKTKCATSNEHVNLSMLACLREDKEKIEKLGFHLDLTKYDLVALCIREAKALKNVKENVSSNFRAILTELESLQASPVQYCQVLLLLGYHLLNFDYTESIVTDLKKRINDIKNSSGKALIILYLEAILSFHLFVEQINQINKQTESEMKRAKYTSCIDKETKQETNNCEIIPVYTKINIKENSRTMEFLEKSLKRWEKCFKHNIKEIIIDWEPSVTLETLITIGEYAHLYRNEDCEISAWKLAYKLASELEDHCAIVYVTSRSVSLRHINYNWINTAKKYAVNLKTSKDEKAIRAVAIFWISLSDFYFECKEYSEAQQLLNEARNLPDISFQSNKSIYLFSLDVLIRNYHLCKSNFEHQEYTSCLVETLYTMINVNAELPLMKHTQFMCLFSYDVLFTATINIALRMNSLLAYHEISVHLRDRLVKAQVLGATVYVAEILKTLCLIDLSRFRIDDCEVKLQGLEHILHTEAIELSMNAKPKAMISNELPEPMPTRVVTPIRDIPQNDASPVLRAKVFDMPHFVHDSYCTCYICKNPTYHYLVFASTYIRAQVYALRNNVKAAMQHFCGAFEIKEKLFKEEENSHGLSWHSNQERFHITDYILLLLDFSCFLSMHMSFAENEAEYIAFLALQLCESYNLEGHPIHMAVKELIFHARYQNVFTETDSSNFTVPDLCDIDISEFTRPPKTEICVTPLTQNAKSKQPISIQRKRTPPLFALNDALVIDDDIETEIAYQQPVTNNPKSKIRSRPIRRKIFDEEYSDDIELIEKPTPSRSRSSTRKSEKQTNLTNESTSIKDVVMKVAPLVPDISEHLYKFTDNLNAPVTNDSLDNLISMVGNLKINSKPRKSGRSAKSSSKSSSDEQNKKIDKAIEIFKEMVTKEKHNKSNAKDQLLNEDNTNSQYITSITEPKSDKNCTIDIPIKNKPLTNKENSDAKLTCQINQINSTDDSTKSCKRQTRSIRTRSMK